MLGFITMKYDDDDVDKDYLEELLETYKNFNEDEFKKYFLEDCRSILL